MDNLAENIEFGVDTVPLTIPVRVTMTSYDDAPFEFIASIDSLGQIVLTPTSKNVEFVEANIIENISTEEQETPIDKNEHITTKKTTIFVQSVMLSDTEDSSENMNNNVCADVDEIGQCVISPINKENLFISVTFSDSLNLITEDLQVVDYFGYRLTNTGDGWDIKDPLNNVVETGVATEAAAKIIVLQTELMLLDELTEDTSREDEKQKPTVEVHAEVLEEYDNGTSVSEIDETQIRQSLSDITNQFTDLSGAVSCDTVEEKISCLKVLQLYYLHTHVETTEQKIIIYYSEPKIDSSSVNFVTEN